MLRLGSQEQPILEKSGDDLRIDWGYLYVVAPPGSSSSEAATGRSEAFKPVLVGWPSAGSDELAPFRPYAQPIPVLAETFDLGVVGSSAVSRHWSWPTTTILQSTISIVISFLIGVTEARRLENFSPPLSRTTTRSRSGRLISISQLMADLTKVGGRGICTTLRARFSSDPRGSQTGHRSRWSAALFLKGEFQQRLASTPSMSLIPASPFFLLFNPRLLEAQLKPVLDYASLPRWKFPFAPHDLGTYPLANGQEYGGGERTEEDQMPVEESGNMLLMIAGAGSGRTGTPTSQRSTGRCLQVGEYLRAKGLDPENQLSHRRLRRPPRAQRESVDQGDPGAGGLRAGWPDAAGHADMSNAIRAGWPQDYGRSGGQKMADERRPLPACLRPAGHLEPEIQPGLGQAARPESFSEAVAEREIAFYKSHTNQYGLPLDNRADYTKLDWLAWTASLSGSPSALRQHLRAGLPLRSGITHAAFR